IGGVRVADLKRSHVLRVLEPIWQIKPVTASRTRGRMQQVLDYAAAEGYRAQADNPAAWEGNLKCPLPSPPKIHPTNHPPPRPRPARGAGVLPRLGRPTRLPRRGHALRHLDRRPLR